MDLTIEDYLGWSPIRIVPVDGRLYVDWAFLGKTRFTDPFHDDTIDYVLRGRFNHLFRRLTPIEFLGEMYRERKGAELRGLIFHVSRCGSTLVSRMLAALESNIAISEASIIDRIIRLNASEEDRITILRWVVNAIGRKRFDEENAMFIKFDSWAVLDLDLIKRAFPETPWLFLYRDPVEVIVSNLTMPGAQMVAGAVDKIFPDRSIEEILAFSTEERFARTIGAFCESAIRHRDDPQGLLLNYDRLPRAFRDKIIGHFGAGFSDDEIRVMEAVARFDAKAPQNAFVPDGERKQRDASPNVRAAADKFVRPLYEELERINQSDEKNQ